MSALGLDPTLQRIADAAERIAPCPLTMRTHGAGERAALVIEPVGLAPSPSGRFGRALRVIGCRRCSRR